jgi:hypothetical protein
MPDILAQSSRNVAKAAHGGADVQCRLPVQARGSLKGGGGRSKVGRVELGRGEAVGGAAGRYNNSEGPGVVVKNI